VRGNSRPNEVALLLRNSIKAPKFLDFMLFDFIAPLLIGFLGSLHCLGMCGPIVMAYSLHMDLPEKEKGTRPPALWLRGVFHHAAFHLGRLATYGFLGGLAAGFAHLAQFNQFFTGLRSTLTLGGGILMILFGLILFRVLPFSFISLPSFELGSFLAKLFPSLLRSERIASKVVLGLAVGFLPCMLSWAMIIKAATTQSLFAGSLTTISFGLGTVPALFLAGLSASLFSLKMRFLSERMAAASVIAMGIILIFKGSKYFA
jgi:sulfite exporter TauE/SafE